MPFLQLQSSKPNAWFFLPCGPRQLQYKVFRSSSDTERERDREREKERERERGGGGKEGGEERESARVILGLFSNKNVFDVGASDRV